MLQNLSVHTFQYFVVLTDTSDLLIDQRISASNSIWSFMRERGGCLNTLRCYYCLQRYAYLVSMALILRNLIDVRFLQTFEIVIGIFVVKQHYLFLVFYTHRCVAHLTEYLILILGVDYPLCYTQAFAVVMTLRLTLLSVEDCFGALIILYVLTCEGCVF